VPGTEISNRIGFNAALSLFWSWIENDGNRQLRFRNGSYLYSCSTFVQKPGWIIFTALSLWNRNAASSYGCGVNALHMKPAWIRIRAVRRQNPFFIMDMFYYVSYILRKLFTKWLLHIRGHCFKSAYFLNNALPPNHKMVTINLAPMKTNLDLASHWSDRRVFVINSLWDALFSISSALSCVYADSQHCWCSFLSQLSRIHTQCWDSKFGDPLEQKYTMVDLHLCV
jgi:hypothetical protein